MDPTQDGFQSIVEDTERQEPSSSTCEDQNSHQSTSSSTGRQQVQEISEEDWAECDFEVNDTQEPQQTVSVLQLAAISCIAGGVQFGWAIQLSLLTPYVQTLGIPHAWASFIWLCGPISGLLVQPVVGVWSDRCRSQLGRRRPFIITGSLLIVFAVLLIAYASELGYVLGDNIDTQGAFRPGACIVFVLGFWFLDLSNNTVQGPSRALLADLTSKEQCNAANSFYSLWIALGSVLGYSAGAVGGWYRWFPFLTSVACGEPCANLKAAFLLHIMFISVCTAITCFFAHEVPLEDVQRAVAAVEGIELESQDHKSQNGHSGNGRISTEGSSTNLLERESAQVDQPAGNGFLFRWLWRSIKRKIRALGARGDEAVSLTGNSTRSDQPLNTRGTEETQKEVPESKAWNFLAVVNQLPPLMPILLVITALSWMAWFPFLLFDTDWVGREVYHGDPSSLNPEEAQRYQEGVRAGALGLLLFAVVQGITSAWLDPLCKMFGPAIVWGCANIVTAAAMLLVCSLSWLAASSSYSIDSSWVPLAALAVFAVLGGPFATTLVVPFTLAAQCSAEAGVGVGLSMGVLNLGIVIPQIVVSLLSGPLDDFFGGGNLPAFAAALIFAVMAALSSFTLLPSDLSASSTLDPMSVPHF